MKYLGYYDEVVVDLEKGETYLLFGKYNNGNGRYFGVGLHDHGKEYRELYSQRLDLRTFEVEERKLYHFSTNIYYTPDDEIWLLSCQEVSYILMMEELG